MKNKNFKLIMENWRQFKGRIDEQETAPKTYSNDQVVAAASAYEDTAEDSRAEDAAEAAFVKAFRNRVTDADKLGTQEARYAVVRQVTSWIEWILVIDGAETPGNDADIWELEGAAEKDIIKAQLPEAVLALGWRNKPKDEKKAAEPKKAAKTESEPEKTEQPAPAGGDSGDIVKKVKDGSWRSGGKAFPKADPNIVAKIWELQKLIGATPDGVFGNETARAIRAKYHGK